jgi:Flp pilus assembly protein TadG
MHDQRGLSMSSFVAVVVLALLIVAGLVVDGGAQAVAARRAELVASAAARAAADETAAARLAGRKPDAGAAIAAAQRVLSASQDVTGEVRLIAGRVRVTTTSGAEPVFLSLIGIQRLTVHGSAEADLVSNR